MYEFQCFAGICAKIHEMESTFCKLAYTIKKDTFLSATLSDTSGGVCHHALMVWYCCSLIHKNAPVQYLWGVPGRWAPLGVQASKVMRTLQQSSWSSSGKKQRWFFSRPSPCGVTPVSVWLISSFVWRANSCCRCVRQNHFSLSYDWFNEAHSKNIAF